MGAFPLDFDLIDDDRKAAVLITKLQADVADYSDRRERSFTAREGLIALEFEALLVAVAASNLAAGVELSADDRRRLLLASTRITTIMDEAVG